MAKTKLEIDKREFQEIVRKLERENEFTTLSALWKAVENTEWAQSQKPRPLTASVAMQRALQLKIETTTKPGKKGRVKGTTRKDKLKQYEKNFQKMRMELPLYCKEEVEAIINRAEKGSKTAAIKLKCLECSNFQKSEVRFCQVFSCALYPIRPYKTKKEKSQ